MTQRQNKNDRIDDLSELDDDDFDLEHDDDTDLDDFSDTEEDTSDLEDDSYLEDDISDLDNASDVDRVSDNSSTSVNSTNSALLDDNDISLNLNCEIGSINMSLAQISKLKLGDIIEFVPWPSHVKLTLNGNYFAQGELVEVNGMLGVKIISKRAK
ncbi:MAG: FliM/FliN family flagellar motor switch protein [Neisseriaceae bacterium]